MLKKDNPNYPADTKEKEEEWKQFGKPGNKSETKTGNKRQTEPDTKSHGKECSQMSEEDEECESPPGPHRSCN